jgi:flagellar motility protein MotE (MotC chaperone)
MNGAEPPVRLLPLTIAALACALAAKSAAIVRASAEPGPRGPAATLASAGEAVLPGARAAPPAPAATPPAAPLAAAEAAPDAGAAPIGAPAPPEIGEGERSVLLDLRRRRDELERREQTVESRESMLGAAEGRLSARVQELQALQTRLEALEGARRDREEAGWRGLVRMYEAMKPRDAAAIMNELDGEVLVQVLDRMKEGKAAPVMAAMDPARARSATAKLAELRTRASTPADGR